MTSAQSTRNTSIRTRKIRGDESLVSSISIAARGEGFWGIAGGIHGVKARSGRQYGTVTGGKKAAASAFRSWRRQRMGTSRYRMKRLGFEPFPFVLEIFPPAPALRNQMAVG